MRSLSRILILIVCLCYIYCKAHTQLLTSDYPIQPVEFTKVKLQSGFWQTRVETATDVTIPYAFKKCEETGRVDNFIFAGGIKSGTFKGKYGFNDSDLLQDHGGCCVQF